MRDALNLGTMQFIFLRQQAKDELLETFGKCGITTAFDKHNNFQFFFHHALYFNESNL